VKTEIKYKVMRNFGVAEKSQLFNRDPAALNYLFIN
jgi:hypothetical protein